MTSAPKTPKTDKARRRRVGALVLRKLSEQELIRLQEKLRFFAARKYFGRLDSDELVMEALRLVLDGRRTWNKEYSPYGNLCWIIKNVAFNQLKQEKRRDEVLKTCIVDPTIHWISPVENPSLTNVPPENETVDRRWRLVRRAVRRDGLLRRMIESARKTQVWKSGVIAKDLGIDRAAVYKGKRRLQRRLTAITSRSKANPI